MPTVATTGPPRQASHSLSRSAENGRARARSLLRSGGVSVMDVWSPDEWLEKARDPESPQLQETYPAWCVSRSPTRTSATVIPERLRRASGCGTANRRLRFRAAMLKPPDSRRVRCARAIKTLVMGEQIDAKKAAHTSRCADDTSRRVPNSSQSVTRESGKNRPEGSGSSDSKSRWTASEFQTTPPKTLMVVRSALGNQSR
jgi:hypothetical protein